MRKNTTKATKIYLIEITFELGEVACPYTLELTAEQVRKFWEDATGEIIDADVDICEVIQTEYDWSCIADSASEHLFNYISVILSTV